MAEKNPTETPPAGESFKEEKNNHHVEFIGKVEKMRDPYIESKEK